MFKKILGLIFLSFIISSPAFSGPPPFCYQEEDGSPSGCFKKIKFANGTITDNGDGTYSHSQAGAGGGDITDVGPDCSSGGCFVDGANDRLVFEGSTADTVESTLGATDPTSGDQTFNLPDMAAGGTYTLATTPIFFDDSDTTGNVTYVGCSDSIATAISAATAGDTLVLGSCTYTETGLTVNKALNFIGQGPGKTIFTTSTGPFSVTADNFSLSGIGFTKTSASGSAISIDCSAGTTCQNMNISDFIIDITGAADTGNDGIAVFDSGVNISNGVIKSTITQNGTDQSRGIFIHVAASHDANTVNRIRNVRIESTCTADTSSALCRGLMIWNNGADQSSFTQTSTIENVDITLSPQTAATQTEAFQHQGVGVSSNIYNGYISGGTGGANTQNADLRCDDGATCNFYGTLWGTSRTDTSGGTITKSGQIQASGIFGDAIGQAATSTGSALNGYSALSLTSGKGGDTSATGSQSGGVGGGATLTTGAGGSATAATVTGTGGRSGAFTFSTGAGGAQTTATSTTNVGGTSGDWTLSTGDGGAASGAATTNNGGGSGDVNLYPGAAGTGTTANGTPGYVRILAKDDGTKQGTGVAFGQESCPAGATYCFNGAIQKVSVSQTITAASETITSNTANIISLGTAGGPYTMTSTPSIGAGFAGQELTIYGAMASTNPVTIQDDTILASSGFTNNGLNLTIRAGQVVHLMYLGSKWRVVSNPRPTEQAIYLSDGATLQVLLTTAGLSPSGSTIYLPTGTFNNTVTMTIARPMTIIGQGGPDKCATTFTTSTSTTPIFTITSSGVKLKNLCVSSTGAGTTRGIYVNCTSGTSCTNVEFENVGVTMSGTGSQIGIQWHDAGGSIRDSIISSTSSDGAATGIYALGASTLEAAATVNVYNVKAVVSGASGNVYAFRDDESTASKDITMNVYDGYGSASGAGSPRAGAAVVGGSNAKMNVYGTTLSGTDYDASSATSGAVMTLYNATLVNDLTLATGTLTKSGTIYSSGINLSGTATSSATGSFGWSVVAGANTACNTTCTSACVMGMDTGASVPLACTDATADNCLCAGAS